MSKRHRPQDSFEAVRAVADMMCPGAVLYSDAIRDDLTTAGQVELVKHGDALRADARPGQYVFYCRRRGSMLIIPM